MVSASCGDGSDSRRMLASTLATSTPARVPLTPNRRAARLKRSVSRRIRTDTDQVLHQRASAGTLPYLRRVLEPFARALQQTAPRERGTAAVREVPWPDRTSAMMIPRRSHSRHAPARPQPLVSCASAHSIGLAVARLLKFHVPPGSARHPSRHAHAHTPRAPPNAARCTLTLALSPLRAAGCSVQHRATRPEQPAAPFHPRSTSQDQPAAPKR
jgi:hypothetical protein